ncbi:MAG: DUF433 domain-containing protein [Rubrivivax sp.]|nr:DUF433 domain-containing protein [Pyrinomonadaceae bacterium]
MSDNRQTLSEEEIDELVTAQADDDSAWGKPTRISRTRLATLLTFEDERVAKLPVESDPGILAGAPVFRGTRVPVASLLDNLAAGLSIDEFLDNFPTVTREQVIQVLEFYKHMLARLNRAA